MSQFDTNTTVGTTDQNFLELYLIDYSDTQGPSELPR